jgi:hypothetical protein
VAMTLKETAVNYRMEILLGAILLISGFLNFWNLWNTGIICSVENLVQKRCTDDRKI